MFVLVTSASKWIRGDVIEPDSSGGSNEFDVDRPRVVSEKVVHSCKQVRADKDT